MGLSYRGLQMLVPTFVLEEAPSPYPDNINLWLKSDVDTFQQSDGTVAAVANNDPAGYWGDQSGNGNHIIQATSSKKFTLKTNRLNGFPALSIDALDDSLVKTSMEIGAGERTLFAVAKNNKAGFPASGFDVLLESQGFSTGIQQTTTQFRAGGNSLLPVIGTAYGTSFKIITLTLSRSAPLAEFFFNGVLQASDNVGTVTAATPLDVWVGNQVGSALSGWDGEVVEIIWYSLVLSNANINITGNYLATRYGLSWSDI